MEVLPSKIVCQLSDCVRYMLLDPFLCLGSQIFSGETLDLPDSAIGIRCSSRRPRTSLQTLFELYLDLFAAFPNDSKVPPTPLDSSSCSMEYKVSQEVSRMHTAFVTATDRRVRSSTVNSLPSWIKDR
jgi:hypothetical protein